jgi:nicotinate-nucleotide adenylyltransferase
MIAEATVKQVAVFGGSFDPPHVGHVLAVKYLRSIGVVDEVAIVPVFEHAFHKPLTAFDVRLRLLELAFAGEQDVHLSPIERDLPRPNYTLNTVRALSQQRPDVQLRLVVGADVLFDIDRWHQFQNIIELAPLLVLGRAGVSHPSAPVAVLPAVSSSEIRDRLAQQSAHPSADNEEMLRRLVPKAVIDYIFEQGLYGLHQPWI